MRLAQIQHHLLDLLRRLVPMPSRRPALLQKSFPTRRSIAPQPHIPGLTRYLVSLAQLPHRPLALFILQNKPQLLFHNTALSPWHALCCTRACLAFAVSGMCPVHSVRDVPGLYPTPPPTPPHSSQVIPVWRRFIPVARSMAIPAPSCLRPMVV